MYPGDRSAVFTLHRVTLSSYFNTAPALPCSSPEGGGQTGVRGGDGGVVVGSNHGKRDTGRGGGWGVGEVGYVYSRHW